VTAPLVLASTSPRRRSLLEQESLDFIAVDPPLGDAVEDTLTASFVANGVGPDGIARRLATAKALGVASRAPAGARAVIAADTVVALGTEAIGKPRDAKDARAMIEKLAGKTHDVFSGGALVELATGRLVTGVERSRVTFHALDAAALDAYIATQAWAGKAGGYGVQDREATPLVAKVEGSRSNVVGLPLELLRALAARAGVESILSPRAGARRAGGAAVGLLALLAATTGCPPPPPPPPPASPTPTVTAPTPPTDTAPESTEVTDDVPDTEDGKPQTGAREVTLKIAGHAITAEVADTDARRRLGLMNRDSLADDRGMIFVYPELKQRNFWMHNTRIPLTIAYIRDDGSISSLEDMEAMDERAIPSMEPVRFCLEMNKGWFKVHGIRAGAKVEGLDTVKAKD
jgi:MAF protein